MAKSNSQRKEGQIANGAIYKTEPVEHPVGFRL